MIESLVISLILTLVIEISVSLILEIKNKDDIEVIMWVNICTNPVIVFIANLLSLLNNMLIYNIVILFLEVLVVIIEAKLYKNFLEFDKKSPFVISLINNFISFNLGNLITLL